jgi:hypothetical protein
MTIQMLKKFTNTDGSELLDRWFKSESISMIRADKTSNWFTVLIADTYAVALPYRDNGRGCKASFFGDKAYYKKHLRKK